MIRRDAPKIFKHPALPGLFALSTTFTRHAFPLHIHDTYTMGVIVSGVNRFWNRGAHHFATRQTICVVNAGEPHTGGTCTAQGFSYLNLYIPAQLLLAAGGEPGVRAAPRFDSPIITDPDAVGALLRLGEALDAQASGLLIEERWLALCTLLLSRHVEAPAEIRAAASTPRQIQAVRDVLDETVDDNIRLADLARSVGLSTFQLARGFARHVGLPPHAYHLQRRIERGRAMILSGLSLAEVAARTGFSDQAHFTRRFRRHFGATPGSLQLTRKNVQDRRR